MDFSASVGAMKPMHGGNMFVDIPNGCRYKMTYWEIWNEPDS